jgi:uncharacterized protein
MLRISELYIYPVKSLGGIAVSAAQLTDRGFQYDRRWMLVDEQNQFLTQRQYPQMALLQTGITTNGIEVYHKNNPVERISIPLAADENEKYTVKIWDDWCEALTISKQINEWFSDMLQAPCRLVFMPDDALRKVDMRYAVHSTDITNFSDGYPLLVISQASLDDLNRRLESPLPMDRFRPNIVITGANPYEEDEMEEFIIGDMHFYGVKLCSRCMITTINQQSIVKGKEPLKTLATYRMMNNNIYFGQNILYNKTGIVKTGDPIRVVKQKPKPLFQHRANE